jgi:hypothetical protein
MALQTLTHKALVAAANTARVQWPLTTVITSVKPNPKRGFSATCYGAYVVGQTLAQYTAAITLLGAAKNRNYRDFAWDLHHGFITLAHPGSTSALARSNPAVPAVWAGRVNTQPPALPAPVAKAALKASKAK